MKKLKTLIVACLASGSAMAQPVAAPGFSSDWKLGGNNNTVLSGVQFNVIGPSWASGIAPEMWFTTGPAAAQYRMMIAGGGVGNSDGFVAMGNNLPAGFVPQSRLHLHQTSGQTFIKFTNGTLGSSVVNGLSIGNTNIGFAFYTNFAPDQPHAFATNDGTPTGNRERMRINAFNVNGFIGMGNSGSFTAASQLHINTIGANASAANQLGEVFRTEGPVALDNNWRLLTGAGTGSTQKGRIFTSNTTGTSKTPLVFPLSDNFNIEATQADMVFWANGTQTQGNPLFERMRISSEPRGALDVTRVGISRSTNIVSEPRTMLHIGDGWGFPGAGGHRQWEDIGTYYNRTNDMMYVGLDSAGNDVTDAIVGWGDNPVNAFGNTGIGDRMIFRFLTATGLGTSSGLRGLEMMRMVSDGNNGRVGIGDFVNNPLPSIDPGNTLEIISSANSPQPAGLRFRNLLSTATPITNPGPGVLSVDANGDVIYVRDSMGTGCCIGNLCGSSQNPLTLNSWEVPLNGFNYAFTGQGASGYNVGVGTSCTPTAKLDVLQTVGPGFNTAFRVTTNAPGGVNVGANISSINAIQNYGMLMTVNGSTSATNTLANSTLGLQMNMSNNLNRVYGIYQNINAVNDAWGQRVIVSAPNNTVNVTGIDVSVNTISTGGFANTAVAGRFIASGAGNNYGIYSTCLPTTTASSYPYGPNYAGFFDGDVVTSSATYYTSDKNLKKDVKQIGNSLELLDKLNPVTYKFDYEKHEQIGLPKQQQYGFISQEVKEILPELTAPIVFPEIKDSTGTITREKQEYLGLNYNGFIAILTDAIKEQQKQIEELKEMVMKISSGKQDGSTGQNQTNQVEVELTDKNIVVLNQNVPNPFAESTVITYNIPENTGFAQVIFYNSNGQLIKAVDIREKGAGQLNVFANDLSNGTYTYTLVVDGKNIDTKRMIKTK